MLDRLKPNPGSRRPSGSGAAGLRAWQDHHPGRQGQGKRSPGRETRCFEGGQMPLVRRIPKRGFKNPPQGVRDREPLWPRGVRGRRHRGRGRAGGARPGPRLRRAREGPRPRATPPGTSPSRCSASARRRQKVEPPAARWNSSSDRRGPEHREDPGAPADPLHVRDARGLSHRRPHRDAGHQPGGHSGVLRPMVGNGVRALQSLLGRRPGAALDLRAGHHALHQRVDHLPAADGGGAPARGPPEGRRAGPQEDHPVDPLRDGRARPFQSFLIAVALESGQFGEGAVPNPGLGLPAAWP